MFSIVFSTVSDLFGQWYAVFRGPIFLIKSQANDKACRLKIDCLWLIFAQIQRRRNRIFAPCQHARGDTAGLNIAMGKKY